MNNSEESDEHDRASPRENRDTGQRLNNELAFRLFMPIFNVEPVKVLTDPGIARLSFSSRSNASGWCFAIQHIDGV
jgi:hypothetical protein